MISGDQLYSLEGFRDSMDHELISLSLPSTTFLSHIPHMQENEDPTE